MSTQEYTNERIRVTFDPARCTHSANCVKSLSSVFDVKVRPWINMDGAEDQRIIDVVRACPSGALQVMHLGSDD